MTRSAHWSVTTLVVAVAWAPADDANPVVQDFVRCCPGAGDPAPAPA
ncbi:hypothetical protein [Streptomyces sp. ME19-01-6]|nr:hypothetical protein [Streptomyces sp. ME19-01-6]MDX3225836.1 hypothetical protein [Streptomyces sp. ME19-01-6]